MKMRSGQAGIEIATDESPTVSEYQICDPANSPNGKVFSLPTLRHIPSVNDHYVSEMHLAQGVAMEMDGFV
jgi:hypothetical protein